MNVIWDRHSHQFWGPGLARVFISYASAQKELALEVKNCLKLYSISSFVAADNIEGSEIWPREIERALLSMNFFVALLTNEFHKSTWPNQEVGFAYALGKPIIVVKMGVNPDGFIRSHQALDCTNMNASDIANRIYSSLLNSNSLFPFFWDLIMNTYSQNPNQEWDRYLTHVLSQAKYLHLEQERQLVTIFNSNQYMSRTHDLYTAIADQLKRLTGNNYILHEPIPGRQRLALIDNNRPVVGRSSEYCIFPGLYRAQCHPNVQIWVKSRDVFPYCFDGGHGYHYTEWDYVSMD